MSSAVLVANSEKVASDSTVRHSEKGSEHVARPAPSAVRARAPFDWPLFWAKFWYWLWNIVTKGLITVVYLQLITQGAQYVFPDIGLRLYKIPGLAFLQDYTATYRLTLAHVFVTVPLVAAWILWHLNLELYLRPEAFAHRFRRWDLDRMKRVIVTMGVIVITSDACLFAAAFMLAGWGAAKFSASAVLATLFYCTVLGFVTFISLVLADSISRLKRKED